MLFFPHPSTKDFPTQNLTNSEGTRAGLPRESRYLFAIKSCCKRHGEPGVGASGRAVRVHPSLFLGNISSSWGNKRKSTPSPLPPSPFREMHAMQEQQSSSERSTALIMNTLWSSEPGPGPGSDRTATEMQTHNSSAGAARKARSSQPAPPQTMPPVARRAKCIAATAQPNSVGNPSRTVQVPLCSSSRGQVRTQRYSVGAEGSSRPYSCQWGH